MPKILVVDDEPDQRFLLRRIFERAGHEVTEACDGAAALKAVGEIAPGPGSDRHDDAGHGWR
jgi:CheY-like chemotaxis protein